MRKHCAFKKSLSAVLSIVLALSLCVAPAFASSQASGEVLDDVEDGTIVYDLPTVGRYYATFSDYQAEQDAAMRLNEEIAGESFVLLKNRNNALPLTAAETNVTAFGISSAYPSYGAQGSGAQSVSVFQEQVTLRQGLENAGIYVNPAVFEAYQLAGAATAATKARETSIGFINYDLTPEQLALYEDTFALYDDAAIVVVTREGGEGEQNEFSRTNYYDGGEKIESDEYAHGLMLTPNEREVLAYAEEHFDKVIVLINTTNPMELGELEDDDKVDAILWVGAPGVNGFDALGKVLTGEINPSGHLTDIYPANFTQDPTYYNYGDQSGAIEVGAAEGASGEISKAYDKDGNAVTMGVSNIQTVSYLEGIYMGYRWYETQAELGNYYLSANMPHNSYASYDVTDNYYNRDNGVVYPFGYGLSYTTFKWSGFSVAFDSSTREITAKITVTNTGSVAGKDVVELYYSDPYINGEIEKASANLVQFAKTKTLQPGESQTITIVFNVRDMASFDYNDANNNGFAGYELDAGKYIISARSDSHVVMSEASVTLSAWKYDGSDEAHNYNEGHGSNAEVIFSETDSSDSDYLYNTYGDPNVQKYISRAGGTLSLPVAVASAQYSDEWVDRMTTFQSYTAADAEAYHEKYSTTYIADDGIPETWTQADVGTTEKTAIQLSDMVDVDYPTYIYDEETNSVIVGDDEATQLWDEFLNQLTIEEMKTIVGTDHGRSSAQERYGLPQSGANDGPSKLQTRGAGVSEDGVKYDGTWWASEPNIASTWNVELAYAQGLMIGNESLYQGVTGLWGFGLNTHRGPWGARAFEYYSEDGVLAGYISAYATKGCTDLGVIVYNKHYALNDQDEYRNTADGCCVFVTEQALRQLYLKPFELAVKVGNMNGAMMSFMRVGVISADNNYNMIEKVLRGEWGFEGDICTDAGGGYCGDAVILAGNDWPLMSYNKSVTGEWDGEKVVVDGQTNATQWYALRKNAMHFLYGISHSNAMKNLVDLTAFQGSSLAISSGRSSAVKLGVTAAEIGAGSVKYSVVSGSLPEGMKLTNAGTLSGTPQETGTFEFTVRMTANNYLYSEQAFSVTVEKVFVQSTNEGVAGDEKFECIVSSDTVKVGDEFASVSYSAEGLPEGVSMAEDGTIYGTPAAAGEYEVTVTAVAQDASGNSSTYVEAFPLVILEAGMSAADTAASGGVNAVAVVALVLGILGCLVGGGSLLLSMNGKKNKK